MVIINRIRRAIARLFRREPTVDESRVLNALAADAISLGELLQRTPRVKLDAGEAVDLGDGDEREILAAALRAGAAQHLRAGEDLLALVERLEAARRGIARPLPSRRGPRARRDRCHARPRARVHPGTRHGRAARPQAGLSALYPRGPRGGPARRDVHAAAVGVQARPRQRARPDPEGLADRAHRRAVHPLKKRPQARAPVGQCGGVTADPPQGSVHPGRATQPQWRASVVGHPGAPTVARPAMTIANRCDRISG